MTEVLNNGATQATQATKYYVQHLIRSTQKMTTKPEQLILLMAGFIFNDSANRWYLNNNMQHGCIYKSGSTWVFLNNPKYKEIFANVVKALNKRYTENESS